MSEDREIRFYGSDSIFSNFFPSAFQLDGLEWSTVEHYFQAQKFMEGYPQYGELIRSSNTPGKAKSLGQTRELQLRPDWEDYKEDVMRRALYAKFTQVGELTEQLLGTGEKELIEDSRDRYWGNGKNGLGLNRLGVLLMETRQRIREEQAAERED